MKTTANLCYIRSLSNLQVSRSAFLCFKDGIYLNSQASQYKYRGYCDAAGTVHLFFIKNSRVGTGATSHQEHSDGNNCETSQHPYVIVFGKKRGCIIFRHIVQVWRRNIRSQRIMKRDSRDFPICFSRRYYLIKVIQFHP